MRFWVSPKLRWLSRRRIRRAAAFGGDRRFGTEHAVAVIEALAQASVGIVAHQRVKSLAAAGQAVFARHRQILVEGEYSGIVKPWEHYIPIRPDASDFPQVLDAMRDRRLVDRLISNCRETILSTGHLRYRHLAENVIDLIATHKKRKRVTSNCDLVCKVARRYEEEMPRKYADHWRRQAVRAKLVGLIDRSPAISGVVRAVWSSVRG